MRRVIIKEGPLVFLRNVIWMELVAALIMYAASFLENYEQIFGSTDIGRYIRYDIFLIVIFSVFQLAYVSVLFLDWYFSHFEISEKGIVRRSGLLFRHRKSVNLDDVVSIEIYQSPLSRLMYHATIILEHRGGRFTKLKNIPNFEEYLHILRQMTASSSGKVPAMKVTELLEQGEGISVEFKETLRYDARKGEVSREMERMALKTVAAFMNARGGTLLIGVNDRGEVVGLEDDYKNLPKKSRDGFENHFGLLIKTMIGLPFAKYVSVRFESVRGKDVCVVTAEEGHKPAYLRDGDRREDFFVRVGNSTQPFSMSEAEEYIKTRWK